MNLQIRQLAQEIRNLVKMFTLSLLLNLFFSFNCLAGALKPFTSDGCSAFPDGTFQQKQLWLKCCTAHDFAYWKGGTYEDRERADIALKECVASVGEKKIALLMLAGVRVGGTPYLPTSFRWGYGWPYPRFYGELTAEEENQVEELSQPQESKHTLANEK